MKIQKSENSVLQNLLAKALGGTIMYNSEEVTKIYTGSVQVTEDLPFLKIFTRFQEEFPTTSYVILG